MVVRQHTIGQMMGGELKMLQECPTYCKAYVTKDSIIWIFMIKFHILLYRLLLCSVL